MWSRSAVDAWANWFTPIWMTLHHTEIGVNGELHPAEESENEGSIPLVGFFIILRIWREGETALMQHSMLFQ